MDRGSLAVDLAPELGQHRILGQAEGMADVRDRDAWSVASSPRGAAGSHKGSEFSLEYLPNPMEVIEELNNIRVRFTFDDEKADQARKRRATINRSQDSFCSDSGVINSSNILHQPLASVPNERQTIQHELLARLEALNGIEATYIKSLFDDGVPRLGIYTEEERIQRINAYREKRKKRVFGKVRYVLRKRASEGRSRFKGRFAKEESAASPNTDRDKSVEQVTAENLHDSTSWLEKMTLGAARRLSGTFNAAAARKRASLPSRPATPLTAGDDDLEKHGSWSSWLLKNRRKSSASAASGRFSDAGSQRHASPAHIDAEVNAFFADHNVEPDRKRLTSGSSALFNEITFDPDEFACDHHASSQ